MTDFHAAAEAKLATLRASPFVLIALCRLAVGLTLDGLLRTWPAGCRSSRCSPLPAWLPRCGSRTRSAIIGARRRSATEPDPALQEQPAAAERRARDGGCERLRQPRARDPRSQRRTRARDRYRPRARDDRCMTGLLRSPTGRRRRSRRARDGVSSQSRHVARRDDRSSSARSSLPRGRGAAASGAPSKHRSGDDARDPPAVLLPLRARDRARADRVSTGGVRRSAQRVISPTRLRCRSRNPDGACERASTISADCRSTARVRRARAPFVRPAASAADEREGLSANLFGHPSSGSPSVSAAARYGVEGSAMHRYALEHRVSHADVDLLGEVKVAALLGLEQAAAKAYRGVRLRSRLVPSRRSAGCGSSAGRASSASLPPAAAIACASRRIASTGAAPARLRAYASTSAWR